MSWITDHQILLAGLALGVLIVVGLAVVVVHAAGLVRTATRSQQRVDGSIQAISSGLQQAEDRMGQLQEHQEDLTQTVERVGERTSELKILLDTAGKAVAVLRAPLKYLGR